MFIWERYWGENITFLKWSYHTHTDRFKKQLLLSPQHKPVQDDFMEWPSAELCRPASQHGRCCHEEVSARSSPQVCVMHGVTGVIPKSEARDWHFQHCCSPYVTQNLECYAFLTYNRDSLHFSCFHINLESWRCHSDALSKKMLGIFEKRWIS